MEENNYYVKGYLEHVVKRFSQINTITIKCPLDDDTMRLFMKSLKDVIGEYVNDEGVFLRVPVIDLYNCFVYCLSFFREKSLPVDIFYTFCGIIQSLPYLKNINIVFEYNKELLEKYKKISNDNFMKTISKDESIKLITSIYNIDILELNLSNFFHQDIIDMINKSFILNGIMTNSYLKREFVIYFNFDDYVTYMDMFLNNNIEIINELNPDIAEYLRLFPKIIADQKPKIKIITNYNDL